MAYKAEVKENILDLRLKGYSIKELAVQFNVAKSTVSKWVSSVELDSLAQDRLRLRRELGHYRTTITKKIKRDEFKKSFDKVSRVTLSRVKLNTELSKLLCAILFWTEGGKHTDTHVYFMNSDPLLVHTFLKLFRSAFTVDENKFHALVHIHAYHDDTAVKQFWSSTTDIPLEQFYRSYQKVNTGKRTREGYMGCINVCYYDSRIALELRSLYNVFASGL